MSKVKLDVIKPWIAQKITEILGMEDDVVVEFVFNQLEAEKVLFASLVLHYCKWMCCTLLLTFHNGLCELYDVGFVSSVAHLNYLPNFIMFLAVPGV
jgi:hypothetical protein